MAHAYTIYPAKPAFGNYTKHFSYADVLANKRANHIYYDCNRTNPVDCQREKCKQTNRIKSQGDLLAIRKITTQACADGCEVLPFNKSNLQVNLITQLDLSDIVILELTSNYQAALDAAELTNTHAVFTSSKIDPALTPIYSYYTIDPENKLSGNTPCAIQKYVNYMILDTNAFIDGGCPTNDYIPDCFCQP
jgi:hypothetical protein